jgi:hypothetical protein
MFSGVYTMRTGDLGTTWQGPDKQPDLVPRTLDSNGQLTAQKIDPDTVNWDHIGCPIEFNPCWHKATGKLLAIGMTQKYENHTKVHTAGRMRILYSVYDPDANRFPWALNQILQLPELEKYYYVRASSSQWIELTDGTILLPFSFFSFNKKGQRQGNIAVMRCEFDGCQLTYLEHGNEMTVNYGRGFCEPQLTLFQEKFYLTIRNDVQGYVTTSTDGLHYEMVRPWTVDVDCRWPADYPVLQTYGIQQHWITHSDGLYLVYTRRGACNDHVYRHRAPLFMAKVDTENLRIIGATEQRVIPERGARIANFGVANITERETWITTAEWMQPPGCEKYGSNGSVFVARLKWNKKNELL